MRNVCLTLAYDGTDYVGWQIQPNGPSVQATVEKALLKLLGTPTRVTAAGRTDSGVHALGQVINFHLDATIPTDRIGPALQAFLPPDIVVQDAADVPPDFHATYWATRKRYRYLIQNGPRSDPFLRRFAWWHRSPLDVAAMHQAAAELVGTHDFCSFESQHPNTLTSTRTILDCRAGRTTPWPACTSRRPLVDEPQTAAASIVWFEVMADGFLYNMVRSIVGTLIKVGLGRWTVDDVRRVLEARDRGVAGETAPAQGLFLVHVDYDVPTTGDAA